jgi:glycosyltransferase involved in cell wall biosynthesis
VRRRVRRDNAADDPLSTAGLKICYFGTYSSGEGYPVNRVLIQGLRSAGATVWECRAAISEDEGPAAAERWRSARGPLAWVRLAMRWVLAWARLVARWFAGPPADVVVVGYLGHVDVFLAKILTRRPIVLNALLSLHDTVVHDRGLLAERSVGARFLRALDRLACRVADLVFLDTQAHIEYFRAEFGLPATQFHRVLVGSDRATRSAAAKPPGARCRVLFVGTFIPLHGVGAILDAATRLEQSDARVTVRLIGRGQELGAIAERIRQSNLTSVELIDRWISGEEYEQELADADICLGAFGATAKARRVIPSKVYDALAAGRAIITADTPAIRELLTHAENAWLCPPHDGAALADAVMALARDEALRGRLAAGARRTYEMRCSPEVIGRDVVARLEGLVKAESVGR